MVKLGFIGLGGMGLGQVNTFAPLAQAEIVAGADPSGDAQKKFVEQHPDAVAYSDYKDLLKDKNVDAVVIATPTLLHRPMCIDALKSGRPVMTEKPLARTVAECKKMIDVADKAKLLLMVAQCRRFDTDWGCFRKIFTEGKIGSPAVWRQFNAGPGPKSAWFHDDKASGGPMMDGAVHNYDFANWIFGTPESVVANSVKLTKTTAMDTCTAIIQYSSGNQAMLSWSWGAAAGVSGIDVLGPKGTLFFGAGPLAAETELKPTQGCYCIVPTGGGKPKLVKFRKSNMYTTQAAHFLACVQGAATCLTPATEAIKAVAVAEAVIKAGRKGGAVKVTL